MAKNQTKPDIGNLIKPHFIRTLGRDPERGLRLSPSLAPMPAEPTRRSEKYYAYLGGSVDSAIILERGPSLPSHPMGRDRCQASHLSYLSTQHTNQLDNTPRPAWPIGAGLNEGGTMVGFLVGYLFGSCSGAAGVGLIVWANEVLRTPLRERRGHC